MLHWAECRVGIYVFNVLSMNLAVEGFWICWYLGHLDVFVMTSWCQSKTGNTGKRHGWLYWSEYIRCVPPFPPAGPTQTISELTGNLIMLRHQWNFSPFLCYRPYPLPDISFSILRNCLCSVILHQPRPTLPLTYYTVNQFFTLHFSTRDFFHRQDQVNVRSWTKKKILGQVCNRVISNHREWISKCIWGFICKMYFRMLFQNSHAPPPCCITTQFWRMSKC